MKIIILLTLLLSQLSYAADIYKMEVIVNDEQKNQLRGIKKVKAFFKHYGGDFQIYSLDDVQHFEDDLSKNLSSNEEKAKKQAAKKLAEMDQAQLGQRAMRAYQAKMLTLKYTLEKYPAIVFNQEFVVYGEFNLKKALYIFKNSRRTQ